jgi:hypothetical protein
MKQFVSATLMLALVFFATESHASGAPTSSFAPRTSHRSHASMSHKRHQSQGGHFAGGHGSSNKGGHTVNSRTADHNSQQIPPVKPPRGRRPG